LGLDLNTPATKDTPRLVRLFSKRFAVQERIGHQIADALETMLHPHGVAVFLEAHHLCIEMRG
jgi:GTP cyclohydrolase IA